MVGSKYSNYGVLKIEEDSNNVLVSIVLVHLDSGETVNAV
jgi:hypothetical protein